ncbi:ras guanine nucleotide exchange factor domain-containing protein [Mycena epipterygia]|nr:ras guanine nucleotide exchange factor domain-containing protein [Mycena epipterygia]
MPHLSPDERRRKINKKIAGPALAIDTDLPESIHSDEPDAPSSPLTMLTTARHGLPVEVLFPSLTAPSQMLRQMTDPEQLEQMITVVPIFCSSIDSILKGIRGTHFLLPTCLVYQGLNECISRTSRELAQHVTSIATGDTPRTAEATVEALRLVEKITERLPVLLRTVETLDRMTMKPLPEVPDEDSEDLSTPDDVFTSAVPKDLTSSPLVGDNDQLPPESPTSDATDSTLVSSGTLDSPTSESPGASTTPKGKKHKFIRRILQMPSEPSKPKPTEDTPPGDTPETKTPGLYPSLRSRFLSKRAPLGVANPDVSTLASSTPTLVPTEGVDENAYVVRQSFIYDRADPLCPDQKVDMPLPFGDTVAIRLDANGEVKAATLPALIQLLTSHHVLSLDDLCETFFLSFRLFSCPVRLIAALRSRWDELPPTQTALRPSQRRVWVQHVHHIRNCIAHLILAWVDEYWRPTSDGYVVRHLRNFVQKRFPHSNVDEGVTALVLAAIDRADQMEHFSRLQRALEVERPDAPPVPPVFSIVLRPEDDYTLNLTVFETMAGRERFAAQLTDLVHRLFRTIDPEEAVARWVSGEPTFFDLQKFEEELLFWVAQSILALKNREERVAMMEFWLDVATLCVTLRNFSSASAIFGGLVFSPVERLSLTILDIAIPSKEQYRKLNAIFDGTNNFAVYRRAFSATSTPAVPLMTVLHKDVISANEISGPVALTNDPDAAKTLIHFSAFRMIKKTICTMEACLVPFNIEPVPIIQDWIRTQLAVLPRAGHAALSEKMDNLSRDLETRAPPPIQKGQTWLQTVKGSIESGEFTLLTLPDPGLAPPAPKLRKNRSIATMLNLRTTFPK